MHFLLIVNKKERGHCQTCGIGGKTEGREKEINVIVFEYLPRECKWMCVYKYIISPFMTIEIIECTCKHRKLFTKLSAEPRQVVAILHYTFCLSVSNTF